MTPPESYFAQYASWSDVRETVERFYRALRDRNAGALADLADEQFAENVVVQRPDSLPHGGTHSGIEAVKALLAAMASRDSAIDPAELTVEHVIEAPEEEDRLDHVVVAVGSTLEWWTFEHLRVTRIRVFRS